MRKYFSASLALVAALFFSASAFAKTIVIYHTSDVHGWYTSRPAKWDKESSTRTIGGFPALSALVQKEKEHNPVILLDSGDWYQGTPEGNFTKGLASIQLMNKLGYTASAIGNHEFDYGEENLKAIIAQAKFPVLASNITNKKDGTPVSYAKPYTIVEVAGEKIGIIGISLEDTPLTTMPKNVEQLQFENEAKAAARMVPEVKKQGVNAIVIIVHNGIAEGGKHFKADWKPAESDYTNGTLAIASAVKGDVQVILGGHRHSTLATSFLDPKSGVLIGESGYSLTETTRVEMNFDDKTGAFTGATGKAVNLWTDQTGEDASVYETLKPVQEQVGKTMAEKLSVATAPLLRREKPGEFDNPLADLTCDILRDFTKAQIAIQNTHGLRSDVEQGPVTYRDIYQVMPFENTIVTLEMTGEQLAQLMQHAVHGDYSSLQVSGITVVASETDGKKTVTLSMDGKPLDPAAWYTVATSNYLLQGGDNASEIARGRNIKDTAIPIREVLIDGIKAMPEIKAPATGRIKKI
jgi:2',3'-cyclic-nucleotide 2'-phosphodiesterase/3'-nucleotidase